MKKVQFDSELSNISPVKMIFWTCFAVVLLMQGIFTFSSMLPFFFNEWQLDSVDAGWISGIYYGAYMVFVLILVSITDWIDAKKIFIGGALITCLSCFGFAFFAEGYWTAMLFRTMGGIGLAGTYMPGLKALTDRLTGKSRVRATSFYTSSFGVGSAFSFLIGGYIQDWFAWEIAFWFAGICALLAILIIWIILDNRPNKEGIRSGLSSLDFRPVLRNPIAMGWIACYSTHNYELFAFRSWIVAYLAFALSGLDSGNIQPSLIVFVGVLLSMPASVIGNELSMRFGRTRIVNSIMGLSAVFAFLVGNSVGTTAPLLITIVLVYGCFVTGESASITTGAIESATEDSRGVTLAVHSSIGFIGSFLGPVGFGIILNYFGGHNSENAWFWAFASTGIILLVGPLLNFYLRNYKLNDSKDFNP